MIRFQEPECLLDERKKIRVGPGRPTPEQSQIRQEELLDTALEIFLEKGFELATMEGIAKSVGMTKRTVYVKYADKQALFLASIQRAINRSRISVDLIQNADCGDIHKTLTAIAHVYMETSMSDVGQRLQRIIYTESYRFPQIQQQAFEQNLLPVIKSIADILKRYADSGFITVDEPQLAAITFITMTVSTPIRAAVWRNSIDKARVEKHMDFAVMLFLNGVKPR